MSKSSFFSVGLPSSTSTPLPPNNNNSTSHNHEGIQSDTDTLSSVITTSKSETSKTTANSTNNILVNKPPIHPSTTSTKHYKPSPHLNQQSFLRPRFLSYFELNNHLFHNKGIDFSYIVSLFHTQQVEPLIDLISFILDRPSPVSSTDFRTPNNQSRSQHDFQAKLTTLLPGFKATEVAVVEFLGLGYGRRTINSSCSYLFSHFLHFSPEFIDLIRVIRSRTDWGNEAILKTPNNINSNQSSQHSHHLTTSHSPPSYTSQPNFTSLGAFFRHCVYSSPFYAFKRLLLNVFPSIIHSTYINQLLLSYAYQLTFTDITSFWLFNDYDPSRAAYQSVQQYNRVGLAQAQKKSNAQSSSSPSSSQKPPQPQSLSLSPTQQQPPNNYRSVDSPNYWFGTSDPIIFSNYHQLQQRRQQQLQQQQSQQRNQLLEVNSSSIRPSIHAIATTSTTTTPTTPSSTTQFAHTGPTAPLYHLLDLDTLSQLGIQSYSDYYDRVEYYIQYIITLFITTGNSTALRALFLEPITHNNVIIGAGTPPLSTHSSATTPILPLPTLTSLFATTASSTTTPPNSSPTTQYSSSYPIPKPVTGYGYSHGMNEYTNLKTDIHQAVCHTFRSFLSQPQQNISIGRGNWLTKSISPSQQVDFVIPSRSLITTYLTHLAYQFRVGELRKELVTLQSLEKLNPMTSSSHNKSHSLSNKVTNSPGTNDVMNTQRVNDDDKIKALLPGELMEQVGGLATSRPTPMTGSTPSSIRQSTPESIKLQIQQVTQEITATNHLGQAQYRLFIAFLTTLGCDLSLTIDIILIYIISTFCHDDLISSHLTNHYGVTLLNYTNAVRLAHRRDPMLEMGIDILNSHSRSSLLPNQSLSSQFHQGHSSQTSTHNNDIITSGGGHANGPINNKTSVIPAVPGSQPHNELIRIIFLLSLRFNLFPVLEQLFGAQKIASVGDKGANNNNVLTHNAMNNTNQQLPQTFLSTFPHQTSPLLSPQDILLIVFNSPHTNLVVVKWYLDVYFSSFFSSSSTTSPTSLNPVTSITQLFDTNSNRHNTNIWSVILMSTSFSNTEKINLIDYLLTKIPNLQKKLAAQQTTLSNSSSNITDHVQMSIPFTLFTTIVLPHILTSFHTTSQLIDTQCPTSSQQLQSYFDPIKHVIKCGLVFRTGLAGWNGVDGVTQFLTFISTLLISLYPTLPSTHINTSTTPTIGTTGINHNISVYTPFIGLNDHDKLSTIQSIILDFVMFLFGESFDDQNSNRTSPHPFLINRNNLISYTKQVKDHSTAQLAVASILLTTYNAANVKLFNFFVKKLSPIITSFELPIKVFVFYYILQGPDQFYDCRDMVHLPSLLTTLVGEDLLLVNPDSIVVQNYKKAQIKLQNERDDLLALQSAQQSIGNDDDSHMESGSYGGDSVGGLKTRNNHQNLHNSNNNLFDFSDPDLAPSYFKPFNRFQFTSLPSIHHFVAGGSSQNGSNGLTKPIFDINTIGYNPNTTSSDLDIALSSANSTSITPWNYSIRQRALFYSTMGTDLIPFFPSIQQQFVFEDITHLIPPIISTNNEGVNAVSVLHKSAVNNTTLELIKDHLFGSLSDSIINNDPSNPLGPSDPNDFTLKYFTNQLIVSKRLLNGPGVSTGDQTNEEKNNDLNFFHLSHSDPNIIPSITDYNSNYLVKVPAAGIISTPGFKRAVIYLENIFKLNNNIINEQYRSPTISMFESLYNLFSPSKSSPQSISNNDNYTILHVIADLGNEILNGSVNSRFLLDKTTISTHFPIAHNRINTNHNSTPSPHPILSPILHHFHPQTDKPELVRLLSTVLGGVSNDDDVVVKGSQNDKSNNKNKNTTTHNINNNTSWGSPLPSLPIPSQSPNPPLLMPPPRFTTTHHLIAQLDIITTELINVIGMIDSKNVINLIDRFGKGLIYTLRKDKIMRDYFLLRERFIIETRLGRSQINDATIPDVKNATVTSGGDTNNGSGNRSDEVQNQNGSGKVNKAAKKKKKETLDHFTSGLGNSLPLPPSNVLTNSTLNNITTTTSDGLIITPTSEQSKSTSKRGDAVLKIVSMLGPDVREDKKPGGNAKMPSPVNLSTDLVWDFQQFLHTPTNFDLLSLLSRQSLLAGDNNHDEKNLNDKNGILQGIYNGLIWMLLPSKEQSNKNSSKDSSTNSPKQMDKQQKQLATTLLNKKFTTLSLQRYERDILTTTILSAICSQVTSDHHEAHQKVQNNYTTSYSHWKNELLHLLDQSNLQQQQQQLAQAENNTMNNSGKKKKKNDLLESLNSFLPQPSSTTSPQPTTSLPDPIILPKPINPCKLIPPLKPRSILRGKSGMSSSRSFGLLFQHLFPLTPPTLTLTPSSQQSEEQRQQSTHPQALCKINMVLLRLVLTRPMMHSVVAIDLLDLFWSSGNKISFPPRNPTTEISLQQQQQLCTSSLWYQQPLFYRDIGDTIILDHVRHEYRHYMKWLMVWGNNSSTIKPHTWVSSSTTLSSAIFPLQAPQYQPVDLSNIHTSLLDHYLDQSLLLPTSDVNMTKEQQYQQQLQLNSLISKQTHQFEAILQLRLKLVAINYALYLNNPLEYRIQVESAIASRQSLIQQITGGATLGGSNPNESVPPNSSTNPAASSNNNNPTQSPTSTNNSSTTTSSPTSQNKKPITLTNTNHPLAQSINNSLLSHQQNGNQNHTFVEQVTQTFFNMMDVQNVNNYISNNTAQSTLLFLGTLSGVVFGLYSATNRRDENNGQDIDDYRNRGRNSYYRRDGDRNSNRYHDDE